MSIERGDAAFLRSLKATVSCGGFYERTKKAIRELSENPRPMGCKKLTGREGWRVRVGNYRMIYEVNDKEREVTILHIGHRRDVYRR